MPDDRAPGQGSSGSEPSIPAGTSEKCRKCGYDLTGLAELPRCPKCGDRWPRSTDSRLLALNVIAVIVAIWAQIQPNPTGFVFMFGPGPDVIRICCIIPLQWGVAMWAVVAATTRQGPRPRGPLLLIGVAIPVLLAVPTCLSLR